MANTHGKGTSGLGETMTVNKAKSILVSGVNEVTVGEVEIPSPGDGEILVETVCTCVSPGTELRCLSGKGLGNTSHPYIPGYSNVGTVIARGDGVDIEEGTLVLTGGTQKANIDTLWGGHVGMVVTEAGKALPLPDGTDPVAASAAVLAAIAYHGVRLSNPRSDESVAAVGLGPIGMFSALLHAAAGSRVVGFDLHANRVELARSLGLEAVQVEGNLANAAKAVLPEGADIVVDSTGANAVLQQSIQLGKEPPWDKVLRDTPRLVIQGSYPGDVVFNYHAAFFREYSILFPRNRTLFDVSSVLDLISRGKLPARKLVTRVCPPEGAPEVYQTLRERPQEMMTAVFEW